MKLYFKSFFVALVSITIPTIIVASLSGCSKKYSIGYYLSTNDLYCKEGYDTLSILPFNTKKFDNVEISVSPADNNHWEYNSNTHTIKYLTEYTEQINEISITITFNNQLQTNSVFFHNNDDYEKMIDTKDKLQLSTFSICGIGSKGRVWGTAWIIKHDESTTYDLMTNYHVYEDFVKMNVSKYTWSNSFHTSQPFINKLQFILPTNADGIKEQPYGTDTCLIKNANFGISDDNFNKINTECNSNNNYFFKMRNDESSNIEDNIFFIGGYPITNTKKGTFKYSSIYCRASDYFGYNTNYENSKTEPKELVNMSHFTMYKKNWSYSNDIIMKPLQCSSLTGGSSGSPVLDQDSNLVGIYWGGRTLSDTNAYCGNIETLYHVVRTPENCNGEFLDGNITSDSSGTKWYSNIEIPISA